jgi:iron(III) transport system substrate-binding protein
MKRAIVALVLVLAACGGTAAPASAPPPSSGPGSTAGASGPLEDLKAQAQKEGGKVLWYDSVEQDQGDKIIEQFKADYPFMSGAKFVSVVSGQRVARITQESSAKGPTADVDFGNAQTITDFKNKGFVESVDWQSLGIKTSPQLAPNDYLLAVTAPFYVIAYNSNKVKADEAPKSLDELLDPKWKGRVGTWARPAALVIMSSVWGEEKALDFAKKLASQQNVRLYDSNFTIAQDIGAGNIDVALTTYHTTLPTSEKGAPLKTVTLNPVPSDPLYGYLLKYGQNKAGGKLLLQWFASAHGARVYEEISGRGNPFVPETKTAQMFKDNKIAAYSIDQQIKESDRLVQLEAQLTKALKGQ